MSFYDVIIVGGGASGFFCAANLLSGNKNLNVLILEKSPKVLSKVRVSGGGRCNVTHAVSSIDELVNSYPRGGKKLRKLFNEFSTDDTIKWFSKRGVKLKTEVDGRMFPVTDSSETIIDCLLFQAKNAVVKTKERVIRLQSANNGWEVTTEKATYQSSVVYFAPGGFPKNEQYDFLSNLELKVVPPVPSLFTFNVPKSSFKDLMGISVDLGSVKLAGTKLEASGPVLVTHWGFSGPAALKLSSIGAREIYQKGYSGDLLINWTSYISEAEFSKAFSESLEEQRKKLSKNFRFGNIPSRLLERLMELSDVDPEKPIGEWSKKIRNRLFENIFRCKVTFSGKTTFKDEFVTAGGIALNEVNLDKMESKKHEGLFFGGEILDVDAVTGGFNFQFAWASAYVASKAILSKL
ncbi:BaiN/RdsA family NAD(P)/FAD-dependent oxidoreductase [Marinigracilibium pacificum]|uniref:NAD(P)/FAD-dependent oxidoreductase n=1 Tax=Marinigracilibium pacificum TaxID=2729599 RepID=A0A848IZF0_9BACT|nr:NAD(P)/FAD-dependent oxidoreductase [Marinigracilibium pacificum]NMM49657.1 NAD(P)/FAD-dependent oxidoreductase [Marinigracilibium pacificum]